MTAAAQSASTISPGDFHVATRVALLDTAERLFSEKGFEGTSVRDIIKAAAVNLGAINYHFGTKERLALEVYARRLQPVNRERIARLDTLEAAAGQKALKIEQILEALIRPSVEGDEKNMPNCDDFMRLISRSFQEPNPEVKKFVEREFAEVSQRFDSAILRALPALTPGELFWRMSFVFGALHHGQERWLRYDLLPRLQHLENTTRPDREGFIQRVISFVAAGLSAPVPAVS